MMGDVFGAGVSRWAWSWSAKVGVRRLRAEGLEHQLHAAARRRLAAKEAAEDQAPQPPPLPQLPLGVPFPRPLLFLSHLGM